MDEQPGAPWAAQQKGFGKGLKSRGESGQVLPLVALCLAVLMGFGGLGMDVGFWQYSQRAQQNAADAAAIGGAQQLLHSGCGNSSAATSAAQTDSANNGFTDGVNNVAVHVQNPPSSGPLAGNNCAVYAQVTRSQVPAFFTRYFMGYISGTNITTEASAQIIANNNDCIIMLDPAQNTNFQGSNVQAPGCSIQINGSANFNGGTVDAATIGEGNYSGSNNGGTFTGASPVKSVPIQDPCSEITSCAYLTNNPPSTTTCNGTYGNNGVLAGGCYNNLNLHGQTVTLQSGGLFVLLGSTNLNGSTIVGSGVTIYVPANSSVNWNMTSGVNLTPPTSGNYAGVSLFQVPGNTANVNFNTSNTSVTGLIYAPSAHLNYNGAFGQYTLIIAAYANLNDSTGEDYGTPPTDNSFIKNVVLAQ